MEDSPLELSRAILEEFGPALKAGGMTVSIAGYDQVLLEEAKRAATRSVRASNREKPRLEAGAASAAILCAAAACEAWVSEFLAHWEATGGDLPSALRSAREDHDALQQCKSIVRFHRPQYPLGSDQRYMQLGCLFRLRDHIAHRNARGRHLDEWPAKLADCARQGAIPFHQSNGADWISVVLVHEVAKWAAETASGWLSLTAELVHWGC